MKVILLIEDNPGIRETTVEILELAHYEVITADNGKDGIEKAIHAKPDLILCDIEMPVIDGFGVFLALNKNLATAGIPFIFLTARSDISDQQKSRHLGVDDYILKPFDDRLLIATIESRIKKTEAAREKITSERMAYIKELEDMLHMTSHRVRQPICTFLGLMQLLDDKNLSADEQDKVLEASKAQAIKLESFTRELTDFIHGVKEKNRGKI